MKNYTIRKDNLHTICYKLSREIAFFCTCFIIYKLCLQEDFIRIVLTSILYLMFYITSIKYEKKKKIITIGYIFIFIILFINNSICSAYYTEQTVNRLNGIHGFWAKDYFFIYFCVTIISYCFILLYLYLIRQNEKNENCYQSFQNKNSLYTIFATLFFALLYKFNIFQDAIIPVYSFLLAGILFSKKRFIFIINFIMIFAVTGLQVFKIRFMVLQIIFPLMLLFLYCNKRKRSISFIFANLLMLLGCLAVCFYGVISEVIKLNTFWGGNYRILDSISSANIFFNGSLRQFYRLFGIWIKTGGYIIYHVQEVNRDFFYGLTYIKFLANIVNIPYINLPMISAIYNLSTYAQPGLLAEGYANFGIVGSITNICLAFFLCEFFSKQYIRKHSFTYLFISIVPFSKILLDGGTINSAIIILIFCIILFAPELFRIKSQYFKYNE